MTDLLRTTPISLIPKNIFFDRDAAKLAQSLLGKILRVKQTGIWLMARIIETEAYYQQERASHSSQGYTFKRRALWDSPGTIYMYYARGGDSLNFSARGAGNAVLIKSAYPVLGDRSDKAPLNAMLANNPQKNGAQRKLANLCSGQTLLCKSLGLKVPDWNAAQLTPNSFELVSDGYSPRRIIQTTRLGIHPDRDAHLPLRFIDDKFKHVCTKDPTRVRNWRLGKEYTILAP